MSIQMYKFNRETIFAFRDGVEARYKASPEIWAIVCNPMHDKAEVVRCVAVFDTAAQANEYVRQSRLPVKVRTADGMIRTFRPDSLLFDYNHEHWDHGDLIVWPVVNAVFAWDCAENPAPPAGPVPVMEGSETLS